ncbi:MAG: ornithine carbamoyltransferase [Elusimicrobia bacterium]|jgi:ornithine carbamoyltransferase|nr:ornithine carbamoyltransferase [Elusimicrobiota bacterium]
MKTSNFLGRDWIEPELDYSREEWKTLMDIGFELKRRFALGQDTTDILKSKTLFTMFFNQSLRTRSTFDAGIQQLGGIHSSLEPGKTYTPARKGFDIPYETERISDVARMLSRVGDAIAIRMYGPPSGWNYGFSDETIKEFAYYADCPIINMESDKYHPCQALADLMTIKEKFGSFKGKKLTMSFAYSGSIEKPRAVPQSVILASTLMGMDVTLAHPEGYDLDPTVIEKCKANAGQYDGSFKITNDFDEGFEGADIVYPKSWGSHTCFNYYDEETGKKIKDQDHDEARRVNELAKGWMTTQKQMDKVNKNGVYMHCLPADRGQEVTDEVIDGPQSVVIDEAENRLHAHKAIMALLMGGRL